jgi:hypothetical protein
MVDSLATEGEVAGTPLTEEECRILAGCGAMSDELSAKARLLVGRIFDKQTEKDLDPRSFSNAMEWATDSDWPNIAEITARVATERNPDQRLHGWPWIKDKTRLVGCGLAAVLLTFAIVIVMGLVFHWK